ncbi:hypothetical protein DQ384_05340 [Sphaerisporangium album]|uniref:Right-handed parallel beta-helix repeat-containing protein n=1 Tax=Sphaerisporangium album TaxID=509200 RepID=A0A367FQH9_9ACTN|nr:hypothetical protein [Sphaerisporangium album]RCG31967.1 hypothetical protein DQ384_05340 [Sphaerisporangium album]
MPLKLITGSRLGRLRPRFPTSATTGPEAWPGWTGSYSQTIEGDDLIIHEGGTAENPRVISGIHMIGGTIHTAPGVQHLHIVGCWVQGWQPGLGGVNLSYGDNSDCQIRYCRISALSNDDNTPESYDNTRLNYGIRVFADDLLIERNEVFWVPDGIQIAGSRNIIRDNFVHDVTFWDDGQGGVGASPGGDHNNCLLHNGGTVTDLTITGNAFILNRRGAGMIQTGALSLQQSVEFPGQYERVEVSNNLIGGGGYAMYSGYEPGKEGNSPGTEFVVTNNRFLTTYFPGAGNFGPATAAQPWGVNGNLWQGNRWSGGLRDGQLVDAP